MARNGDGEVPANKPLSRFQIVVGVLTGGGESEDSKRKIASLNDNIKAEIDVDRAHRAIDAMRAAEPEKENELDAMELLALLKEADELNSMLAPVIASLAVAKKEGVALPNHITNSAEFNIKVRRLGEVNTRIDVLLSNPVFASIIGATVEVRKMVARVLIQEGAVKTVVQEYKGRTPNFADLVLGLDEKSRAHLAGYYAKRAEETKPEDSSVEDQLRTLLPLKMEITDNPIRLEYNFTGGDLVARHALGVVKSFAGGDGMGIEGYLECFLSQFSEEDLAERIAKYKRFASMEESLLALADAFCEGLEPPAAVKTKTWKGTRDVETPEHKAYMDEARSLRAKIESESRVVRTVAVPDFGRGSSEEARDDIGYMKKIRVYLYQCVKIYRNLSVICGTIRDLSHLEDSEKDSQLEAFVTNLKYTQLAKIFSAEGWPEFRGKVAPAAGAP